VVGFTEDNGVWTGTHANGAEYEFTESTGVLRVSRALSDPGTLIQGK
jgi:hypothetical protein